MKGWKTLIWNFANAAVFALEAAQSQYAIPDAWEPYWLAAYITGNVILRLVTTTPVGKGS